MCQTIDYRLRSSLPPGASAATTKALIIISKLTPTTPTSKSDAPLTPICRVVPSESYMQFSKKPILANFGDLPRGEIPEPLKFNRPFRK